MTSLAASCGTSAEQTETLKTPAFLRSPFVGRNYIVKVARDVGPKYDDYKRGGYLWHHHWLYRYFDCEWTLLYVGISNCFLTRDESHMLRSDWRWKYAMTATLETYPDRYLAEIAEAVAIREERPMFNVKKPRFTEESADYKLYRWYLDKHGGRLRGENHCAVCLCADCDFSDTPEIATPVPVWGAGHTKIEP